MAPVIALGIAFGLIAGVAWYELVPHTRNGVPAVAANNNRKKKPSKYNFADYMAEVKITPFVLETGRDDKPEIVIPPPSGDDLDRIVEAKTNKDLFEILCGDQYDDVWALVGPAPAEVFRALSDDVIAHFSVGADQGDSDASST